jgi:hypothetical protein
MELCIIDPSGRNWNYLPYGPFADLAAYEAWVEEVASDPDDIFFAVVDMRFSSY